MNCIFCRIVRSEIPSHKIYEDIGNLAFLDIHPQVKGHTVVIPKDHALTSFDLAEDKLKALIIGVQRAMMKIQEVLNPDGYNVGWNHGDAGGQVVKHLHIHIFPRFDGDGGGSMHSIVKRQEDMTVEEVAGLFK